MPNIKFSYLYRDADNYKNFGYVVFDNPTNMELAEVVHHLKSNLIDGCWFYAKEWKLPDLRFPDTCPSDPTWHEFEGVEYTNEAATMDLLLLPIAWGLLCPSQ